MKRVAQILTLSLLLGLVLVGQASAEAEESSALEVLPTAVITTELSAPSDAAPSEVATRPDPVFLAGSSAGGAGGAQTGLVKGDSASLPPTYVMYEDYLCCQVGNYCDCVYWPGRYCNPLPSGCAGKSPPYCG